MPGLRINPQSWQCGGYQIPRPEQFPCLQLPAGFCTQVCAAHRCLNLPCPVFSSGCNSLHLLQLSSCAPSMMKPSLIPPVKSNSHNIYLVFKLFIGDYVWILVEWTSPWIIEICYVNSYRRRQCARRKCSMITATMKAAQESLKQKHLQIVTCEHSVTGCCLVCWADGGAVRQCWRLKKTQWWFKGFGLWAQLYNWAV